MPLNDLLFLDELGHLFPLPGLAFHSTDGVKYLIRWDFVVRIETNKETNLTANCFKSRSIWPTRKLSNLPVKLVPLPLDTLEFPSGSLQAGLQLSDGLSLFLGRGLEKLKLPFSCGQHD